MKTCSFGDCGRVLVALGYCDGHYRQLKSGKDLRPLRSVLPRVEEDYRDSDGNKVCQTCGEPKRDDEFGSNCRSRDGLRKTCKKCQAHQRRLRVFNISESRFEEIIQAQLGRCPVCSDTLDLVDRFVVDHDHACCDEPRSCGGCVRGILHSGCNTLLGFAKDNPDTLRRAAKYLEEGWVR